MPKTKEIKSNNNDLNNKHQMKSISQKQNKKHVKKIPKNNIIII